MHGIGNCSRKSNGYRMFTWSKIWRYEPNLIVLMMAHLRWLAVNHNLGDS